MSLTVFGITGIVDQLPVYSTITIYVLPGSLRTRTSCVPALAWYQVQLTVIYKNDHRVFPRTKKVRQRNHFAQATTFLLEYWSRLISGWQFFPRPQLQLSLFYAISCHYYHFAICFDICRFDIQTLISLYKNVCK